MRFRLLYVVPTMTLLAATVLPLVVGVETLFYRDVLATHLPFKAAQKHLLEAGTYLPLVDPYRGGQALLGNPNALVLYPTSLLLAVADALWTLNAHFWIHLLVAPWAGYWLGRAWGLRRPGAWCVGTVYAASGYFLSTMNLFNMVAGAALAPALVAACLAADRARGGRFRSAGTRGWVRAWVPFALLWALMILGGEPVLGVTTWALAALALALRRPLGRSLRAWLRTFAPMLAATVAGSFLALPQLVETARILPLSLRGHVGFGDSSLLVQSWHPATLLEQLSPLLFGGTGPGYWGGGFQQGREPLIVSLHLGWIALALVAAAPWRTRAARWALAAVAAGVFLSLGAHNPLLALGADRLADLPGATLLRYPIRLWSMATLGLAVLAGLGFDRLHGLRGAAARPALDTRSLEARSLDAGRAHRRHRLVLAAGLALSTLAILGLVVPGAPTAALMRRLTPEDMAPALWSAEVARWAATWATLAASLLLALLLSIRWRRAPALAAAGTLLVHLGSQIVHLDSLLETDDAGLYRQPAPVVALLPPDARVVSGGEEGLFEWPQALTVDARRPDPVAGVRARRLDATASFGVLWGRRYALALSPDALDSFYSVAVARAFPRADDRQRLRLLRASSVDRILVPRPLELPLGASPRSLPEPAPRLVDTVEGGHGLLSVYALTGTAPRFFVASRVHEAPNLSAAVQLLASPAFDPVREVVLATGALGPNRDPGTAGGPKATVRVLDDRPERVELSVRLPAEDAPRTRVLVAAERTWLPLWTASVDGRPTDVLVANAHRMAVPIPAGGPAGGVHRVVLEVDRRPLVWACGLSIACALALGLLVLAPSRSTGAPSRTAEP